MDYSYALPLAGTLSLATGLLMPLRDGRQGRRATVRGSGPLPTRFLLEAASIVEDRPDAAPATDDSSNGALAYADHDPDDDSQSDESRLPEEPPIHVVFPTFDAADGYGPVPAAVAIRYARPCAPTLPAFPESDEVELGELEPVEVGARPPDHESDEALDPPRRAAWRVAWDHLFRRHAPESGRATSADEDAEPLSFAETLASIEPGDAPIASPIVLTSPGMNAPTRGIPLTRLPLRPLFADVSWTELLDPPEANIPPDRREARLRAWLSGDDSGIPIEALRRAWHEERGSARTLALRLLARRRSLAAVEEFAVALRGGTEEERAIAIDALVALDARDELEVALSDRSDAIAARATLAIDPSRRLEDHRERLARHLDAARCEAVLTLLMGVLE